MEEAYIKHINTKNKIKQDLARLLNREFTDLSQVTIKELLKDIDVMGLTYNGNIMRPEVIYGWQFLYFNKGEE